MTSRPVAAPMSLNFALKQQAFLLRLHPATWHVGYNCTLPACMSVRVAFHQQVCLNQLQLTCEHICSCGGYTSRYICYTCLSRTVMSLCSSGMYVTVAPDTQPSCLLSACMSYSFILSASTYIKFAPDHQPCHSQLHLTSSYVF